MRVTAVRTLTGEPITDLDVSEGSWKSSLTLAGEGSFTIETRDQLSPVDHLGEVVAGWKTTIVVTNNDGTVEYAGLVVDEAWDEATGACTVSTLELDAILEHRLLFGATPSHYAQGSKLLTGHRLGDVIRETYRWALVGYPDAGIWNLPVSLPPRLPGGVTREYWRYNFQSARAFLDLLMGEDGAEDAFLRPRWHRGWLRWWLEIGTPLLDAGVFSWEVATHSHRVRTPVVDVRVNRDWKPQRTGVWAIGAGSEEDTLRASAGRSEVDGPQDLPALDASVPFKNIDDAAQLKSLAVAELRNRRHGIEQWSFGLELGDQLTPESVWPRVGSIIQLRHPGSERVQAGTYWAYVLSVSGTVGGTRLAIESQAVGVT